MTDATAEEDGFELYSYSVICFPKNGSVVPYRGNAGQGEDPFSFGAASGYRFSGCTFSCYFMTNREESATTIWVANDFFYLGSVSFTNSSKDGGNIDLGDNLNNGGKL